MHELTGGRVVALAAYFSPATLILPWMLSIGAAVYQSADLTSLAALWILQLSAIVRIFNKRSEPHYRPA